MIPTVAKVCVYKDYIVANVMRVIVLTTSYCRFLIDCKGLCFKLGKVKRMVGKPKRGVFVSDSLKVEQREKNLSGCITRCCDIRG